MTKIAVLGAGSWGTALARVLALRGAATTLVARDPAVAVEIASRRENARYLPGVALPETLVVTSDSASLGGAEAVFFAVPSVHLRAAVRAAAAHVDPEAILVSLTKGLEEATEMRMSEVLVEELPGRPVVVVSGPGHAEEVARDLPTAQVAAAAPGSLAAGARVQSLLHGGPLRIYRASDVVGVEIAGALKNPIAIAAGIATGLGAGDNAMGALLTRGLAEIARLGVRLGADPLTFSGLSGVGDLATTCYSRHSRNRRLGEAVARGATLDAALAGISAGGRMVAEGVPTVRTALALAGRLGADLPIHRGVAAVLFEGVRPEKVLEGLLARGAKEEDWGIR